MTLIWQLFMKLMILFSEKHFVKLELVPIVWKVQKGSILDLTLDHIFCYSIHSLGQYVNFDQYFIILSINYTDMG